MMQKMYLEIRVLKKYRSARLWPDIIDTVNNEEGC